MSIVSIIVRTKDRPKLLKKALQSIAAQAYKPIEVVLVNDGGCDLDIEEIKSILGDVSLNYIRLETNTGRAHAGNVGIETAKGKYVGFLDDDDEFYPEHITTLVTFLDQSDYKVAYTDTEMVFKNFDNQELTVVDTNKFIFQKDFSYGDLLIENFIPFNSLLFSKDAIHSIGKLNEDFELYEDWDFLIRAGQKFSFFHINRVTTKYNQWSKALQINKSDADYVRSMHLRIIEKYHKLITPSVILGLKQEKEKALVDLKNLMDKHTRLDTSIEELRKEIKGKNDDISHLRVELNERNDCVARLENTLRESETRIKKLEELSGEKDARIRGLEESLSETTSSLAVVTNTTGWKILVKLRHYRDKIVPQGGTGRRLYDLGLKSVRVIRKEGFRHFFTKAGRKLKHGRSAETLKFHSQDAYDQWIARTERRDKQEIQKEIERFNYKPKISIITPVYNVEPKWLNKCIESVVNQFYENWELCIHDDASTNKAILSCLGEWLNRDKRIKVSFGGINQGISAASNQALKSATGEFIALLDNDDELSPDALYENVKLLNDYPDTDLIYSDEDRITETNKRFDPFFKPDWSPQLLFACMYTGHLSVYRKQIVDEVGGFRSEFDFSQDYDLALRITEKTNRIRHIQKVLYHWRSIPGSAAAFGGKLFARNSNIRALKSAVERRGYDAEVKEYPFANRVKFRLRSHPLVSIIIPTDNKKNVFNCIGLLLKNTAYSNFEIIVVTNSLLGEDIINHFKGDRIKICRFDKPFNFSLKCNEGASLANGEYLLFLNDDVEAIDDTWLETMVEVFGKENVAGVSPKLFYENDTIQYAGMVTGVRDLVGTAFHCQPKDSGFYFNMIQSERNVSLLSGACMLISKNLFFEVGGFDDVNTPVMHSDLDLCFKILDKKYELIYTPFAALRHIGHLALREAENEGRIEKKGKIDLYMLKKWGDYISRDPYYTANMREILYQHGSRHYRLIAGRQNSDAVFSKDLLFITHDLSLSGAPLLLFDLACNLRQRGYFVTVMSPCDGELTEKYEKENIPLMIDSTISDLPLDETKKFMANFDLIVANTILVWQAVVSAKENNIPVIWMLHESRAGRIMAESNPKIAVALGLADDVIFACEATESLYKKFNFRNNFRIMSYGARPLEVKGACIAHGDAKLVILQVGSIEPRKGQDILIKSITALSKEYTEGVEAFIVGRKLDNAESREFYDTVQKMLKGKDNIHLIDQVPHEEIGGYMERADLFICSSRDEVFPLTVLEAMSAGKAIISTDVGGVSLMMRNNEDGIIVPNEDSTALGNAIISCYEDRDRLKRLGENAKKRFYENFTIDKFAEKFLAIVEERLDSRN